MCTANLAMSVIKSAVKTMHEQYSKVEAKQNTSERHYFNTYVSSVCDSLLADPRGNTTAAKEVMEQALEPSMANGHEDKDEDEDADLFMA